MSRASMPEEKTLQKNATVSDSDPVDYAISKIQDHLLGLQNEAGFWEAQVFDNPTITAEYVMTLYFLGILDEDTKKKATDYFFANQLSEGGWNLYYDGPTNHSTNLEVYFALLLCGVSAEDPQLQNVKSLIRTCGGVHTSRVFTKIHMALFGVYSWNNIPVINPELMLLPRQAPIHVYEFSSWSRSVIIPLLIIFAEKPKVDLPANFDLETFTHKATKQELKGLKKLGRILEKTPRVNLEEAFRVTQKMLSLYEKVPVKPLRKTALQMAEDWILEHQDPDGNWGGIFPAYAFSLIALRLRGYSDDHPIIKKGFSSLRTFIDHSKKNQIRVQSTVSPVWDTAITCFAMADSKHDVEHPKIQKAVDWILDEQILDVKGDWKFKAIEGTKPGGWAFEHENLLYPDVDDTAMAILTLLEQKRDGSPRSRRIGNAIQWGIDWMLGMQCSDGGWGAFDRNNNRHILNEIPFADLKSLLDPSSPDVTGHAIEALGHAGQTTNDKPIEQAIKYLKNAQEDDGSWFGRWGVNYIYGTAAALSGLDAVGENMRAPYVKRALRFLEKTQHPDGGWGESCASYDAETFVPLAASTASQTAWGLIGLMSTPLADEACIKKAVDFLLHSQNKNGDWTEPHWTGTGFPSHFYLRYDYYRLYFPLMALGRYQRKCEKA